MLPALHSKEDSSKCVTEARKLLANSTITQLYSAEDLINEPLIQKFCMYFQAELPGLEVPPNFFLIMKEYVQLWVELSHKK